MDFFLFHFILFIDAAIICLASSLSNIQKVEEEEEGEVSGGSASGLYYYISRVHEYKKSITQLRYFALLSRLLLTVSNQPSQSQSQAVSFLPEEKNI